MVTRHSGKSGNLYGVSGVLGVTYSLILLIPVAYITDRSMLIATAI